MRLRWQHRLAAYARSVRRHTVLPVVSFLAVLLVFDDLHGQDAVRIPHFWPLEPSEMRGIEGLDYHPLTYPLGWHADGSLIVLHLEFYGKDDVAGAICDGTGLFAIDLHEGILRELGTGDPYCQPGVPYLDAVDIGPGGEAVFFLRRADRLRGRQIMRLELETGNVDTLDYACPEDNSGFSISPDGRRFAFSGQCSNTSSGSDYGLYVKEVMEIEPTLVLTREEGTMYSFTWGPDSENLLVTKLVSSQEESEIFVSDLAGNRGHVIANGIFPEWSPDGQWIAYVAVGSQPGSSSIRMVHPDGSGDKLLFANPPRGDSSRISGNPVGRFLWSQDSQTLFFQWHSDVANTVCQVNLDTGVVLPVTVAESENTPCGA